MNKIVPTPTPFDILYRNRFKADEPFAPAFKSKQPHPINIFYTEYSLAFEIACTGLTREDVEISVESNTLIITHTKQTEEIDFSNYIYNGLAKKSINLAYKVDPKYNLSAAQATMRNGLLDIRIPLAKDVPNKVIDIK